MRSTRTMSKPFAPGDGLSAERLNEALLSPFDIMGGNGIKVTRNGNRYTIGLRSPRTSPRASFFAIVSGATKPGTAWRWEYQIVEAIKTGVGWSGWTPRPGGRTVTAMSIDEMANTDTIAGGVDTSAADYPAGFAPIPVPVGTVVRAEVIYLADGSGAEYWFSGGPTQHDGACEEPGE